MNLLTASRKAGGIELKDGAVLTLVVPATPSPSFTVGLRASALRVVAAPGDVILQAQVELAEISGSDTYVHVNTPVGELVAQLIGVHYFELGAAVTLYFNPAQLYVFDASGALLLSPVRGGGR